MTDPQASTDAVPFESGTITALEGPRVHYAVYGDKGRRAAHLVLLRDRTTETSFSSGLIDLFAPYYRITVLEPDVAGLGVDVTPTQDDLTDALFALFNRFQIGQAVILGIGQEGRVALLFSLAHQERIAALVTVDTALSAQGLTTVARTGRGMGGRLADLATSLSKRAHGKSTPGSNVMGYPDIDPATLKAIRCDALIVSRERGPVNAEHTRLIADSLPHAEMRLVPAGGQGDAADDFRAVDEVIRCWLIDEC